MSETIDIVHRDPHLLVVNKPAGIATTSPSGGDCLVARVREADAEAQLLHPVSRLDAQVSGLVTFARTREANRALREARASGVYQRLYLALALRAPDPPEGRWQAPIAVDPRDPRRRVAESTRAGRGRSGARPAATDYRTAQVVQQAALLYLWPRTGRTHQLRVHCAQASAPLIGDRHYGGPVRLVLPDGRVLRARRVMLHCARLVLPDLVLRPARLVVAAPMPEEMTALWRDLGGGSLSVPESDDIRCRPWKMNRNKP